MSSEKKHRIGLLIGRFQPPHRGHAYLVRKALEVADVVILAIGSANIINHDNPFTVKERDLALKEMLVKEKLAHKILKIIEIDDIADDEAWLTDVLQKTGQIDFVIGNNDWVNGIFEKAGHTVLKVPYYKRNIYEGRKIREKLRKENKLSLRYYAEEE